jgi:hypothetical protein
VIDGWPCVRMVHIWYSVHVITGLDVRRQHVAGMIVHRCTGQGLRIYITRHCQIYQAYRKDMVAKRFEKTRLQRG